MRYTGQDVLGKLRSRNHERAQAVDRAQFADLLADGMKTADAAEAIGRPNSWGKAALARMRRELGPQAV